MASAKEPRNNIPRGLSLGVGFPPRTLTESGGFSSTIFSSVSLLQQLSIFLLSSHWIRGFFIDVNLSVFLFVYCHLLQGFFPLIDLLSDFPSQSPVIGLEGFSPVIWSSFETHQLSYGARMLLLVFRFSSSVLQWVGRFFTKLYSYLYLHLHVRRSSHLGGKAIVMSWSRDMQITGCTWSSHAPTSFSSLPLWALLRVALLSLQPHLLCTNSVTDQH